MASEAPNPGQSRRDFWIVLCTYIGLILYLCGAGIVIERTDDDALLSVGLFFMGVLGIIGGLLGIFCGESFARVGKRILPESLTVEFNLTRNRVAGVIQVLIGVVLVLLAIFVAVICYF
jgi:hypothetical protein